VLHDFIKTNHALLIDRCRAMVASRSEPKAGAQELAHGIPIFLDQLVRALTIEQSSEPMRGHVATGANGNNSDSEVQEMATLHGRDLFEQGFTLEQVVRDYGDVCQAVTNLAFESGASIEVDEFRTFNRCLDNAIAGAVTEYAGRAALSTEIDVQALNSRMGPLAHELRNYLHTAILVVKAIKTGNVGISGATGAVLDRSLLGMRNLIDRALAEVRLTGKLPTRLERVRLAQFLGEIEASALLDAVAHGSRIDLTPVDHEIEVVVDVEMLAAAVNNLLHNAFKFTKPHTEVRLHAHVVAGRVLIEVEDHCGGLPRGTVESLFSPVVQGGEDRSGLSPGLDICRRSVAANHGVLRVRDVPGSGCIFTIDLPYP
jgi:signal transduction histidine kinase